MLDSFERGFFRFELYIQRNITVGCSNIQWDSLITMRNDLDFFMNICQVKYVVFRNLTLFLSIFFTTYTTYYWVTLEYITNNSSGVYTGFSQLQSYFYLVLFVPTSDDMHQILWDYKQKRCQNHVLFCPNVTF